MIGRLAAISRRDVVLASMAALLWLAWQVPLAARQPAGQDEDFYAVPGLGVLERGIPTIPYIPSRDPTTIYYYADQRLLALPPLFFYLQAPLQAALPDHPLLAARLTSMLAGAWALVALGTLGRGLGLGRAGIGMAVLTCALSRAFLFPATMARPDMAATAAGLTAVALAVSSASTNRRFPVLFLTALAAALAMLAHPMGVVPATQAGLTILLARRPPRVSLAAAAIYGSLALALLAVLWAPLILPAPALFRIQFGGNVLNRAGPGLLDTLLDPRPMLQFQLAEIADHFGPIQLGLYVVGLLACLAGRSSAGRLVVLHAVAGLLLLFLFMGQHALRGYYGYPGALLALPLGHAIAQALDRVSNLRARRLLPGLAGLLLTLLLLPGAGGRVALAHLRHRDDPSYSVDRFVRLIQDDPQLPPSARVAVDAPYVVTWFATGRPTVEALIDPLYFDVRTEPFQFALFGRLGHERVRPRIPNLELVRHYGRANDRFACEAWLYRRLSGPSPPRAIQSAQDKSVTPRE